MIGKILIFFDEKHNNTSLDFKMFVSWMKDVSLGIINNVKQFVLKACVDQIIVDIPDGMPFYGINVGHSIPFWMQLKANEW